MGFWKSLWKETAKDWYYGDPSTIKAPDDVAVKQVEPRKEYIRVTLKSTRIVDVRVAFKRFYGAVHSFISLDHINGEPAEFNVVTTPSKLEKLDPKNIDRIITNDVPLLGPIPYYGGRMEIEMGLFAIESSDLSEPFLSILKEMSDSAGVSVISMALPYVDPIKKGISALIGSGDSSSLQIGLSTTFNKVKTGYYVIARVEKSQENGMTFGIDKDFRLVDANGKRVEKVPYLVFQITSSEKNDEWFKIPEIVTTHNHLNEAVKTNDKDKIADALVVFKTAVLTSTNLIRKDALEIYKQVSAETIDIIKELDEVIDLRGPADKSAVAKGAEDANRQERSFRHAPLNAKSLKSLEKINIYN